MGNIGLSLSGGGARAIAFHLGCLRALHKRGLLQQVKIISAVSGGSVIAAMYAYENRTFSDFEAAVTRLLSDGLHLGIMRNMMWPGLLLPILATNLISSPAAFLARPFGLNPPLRRWASRTNALEMALSEVLPTKQICQIDRPNLEVILNACELRTGTAFRFGSRISGNWRFGAIVDNNVSVAHAVTCSSAYPLALPAVDQVYHFVKDGVHSSNRVIIADGGVYDNLGLYCLEPGRDSRFSLHTNQVDYIICCYAGTGQISGSNIPYDFMSRTNAAFETIFRKNQDAAMNRLHLHKQSNQIKGFVLPYLGQIDEALPREIEGLVSRETVIGYPTDFAPMKPESINAITLRGEQLTSSLSQHYLPEL